MGLRKTRSSGRFSSRRSSGNIDMNSLIDLTFLLLVTFIITLPALEKGIPVNLPRATSSKLPTKQEKPHSITITSSGAIYLDKSKMERGIDELEEELKKLVSANPDVPVLLRGDQDQNYGQIMRVVKALYKNKIHRISLVTLDE